MLNPTTRLAPLCLAWFALALANGCTRQPAKVVELAPPEVTVAAPIQRNVTEDDDYTGRVAAVESVEIRARVSGYLTKVNFVEGTDVKQGDLLFEIDPRPYEAQVARAEGDVAKWEATLAKTSADLARDTKLRPTGAVTQEQLESSIAQKKVAEASLIGAKADLERAKLDLEFTKITSPINGRVSRANVTVGNLIQPGAGDSTVLTTVKSIDPIYVYFDIDERKLQAYRQRALDAGQPASPVRFRDLNRKVLVGLATEEGYPHEGYLDFADNEVDSATGTLIARAVVPNPKQTLLPGYFCRVRVLGPQSRDVLMLSDRAILSNQDRKYVLVVGKDNVAQERPVQLGRQIDGLRVVRSGLQPGDQVIVNGLQRARPGMTVTPHPGPMPGFAEAEAASTPVSLEKSGQ